MDKELANLPDDIVALKALLLAARSENQAVKVLNSSMEAMIGHLKLEIAKLRRAKFGSSAERARRLDQLELQLEEMETAITEDACAAETSAAAAGQDTTTVNSFSRCKPVRKPLPAHLPRERVVLARRHESSTRLCAFRG